MSGAVSHHVAFVSMMHALALNALPLEVLHVFMVLFFFSSRRRHTRFKCDWSSDVCSSDLQANCFRRFRSRAKSPSARDGLLYCFFSSLPGMRQPQLQAGRVTCRSGGSDSRGDTCSLCNGVQQGFESIGKGLYAIDHQVVRSLFP